MGLDQNQESENFLRLIRFLSEKTVLFFRATLFHFATSKHKVRTFNEALQKEETKKLLASSSTPSKRTSLTKKQRKVLYPKENIPVTIDNLDWTLCMVLLRTVCGLDEPPNTWDRPPDPEDDSLEGGLAQLNFIQNCLSDTLHFTLTNHNFNTYFKNVSDAFLSISKHVPDLSINEEEINVYKTLPFSPQECEDLRTIAIGWVQDKRKEKDGFTTLGTHGESVSCSDVAKRVPSIGHRVQIHLKEIYLYEMAFICVNPTDQEDTMAIEEMFVNLEYKIGNQHKRNGWTRVLKYKDIFGYFENKPPDFQGNGKATTRILVQGKAGSGKSSLTQKIAFDWTKGDDATLREFENVFIISLRKVKPLQSLYSAIKEQLLDDEDINEIQLENYIKDNNNILLIFDGLDEITEGASEDFFHVVHRKRLRKVCVLITSTPSQAHGLAGSNSKIDVHITLQGFSKDSLATFISNFFANLYNNKPESEEIKTHTKNLHEYIKKNDLEEIAQIPLLLNMLCILYETDKSLPTSISKIYGYFIEVLFQRHKNKAGLEDSEDDKKLYMKTLADLGKLGLDGLVQRRPNFFFPHKKILEKVGKLAFLMGLISTEKKRITIGDNTQYYFLHESFQEYTSACYISTELGTNDEPWIILKDSMTDLISIKNKDMLLRFCAGASQELAKKVLSFLDQKIREFDPDVQKKASDIAKGQGNLTIKDEVVEILEIEAKCLINMETPLPCLLQSLYQLVHDRKHVEKAMAIGALEIKKPLQNGFHDDTTAPQNSNKSQEVRKNENLQKMAADTNSAPLTLPSPPSSSSSSASAQTSHSSSAGAGDDAKNFIRDPIDSFEKESQYQDTDPERTKIVFDLEDKLISEDIEGMEGYEGMGIGGPPLILEIVVSGNGIQKFEKFLEQALGEKYPLKEIKPRYLIIIETVNGIHLNKQAFFPAIKVKLTMRENISQPEKTYYDSQTVCIIVKEKDQHLALTCNHDVDHTKAEFTTRSCKTGQGQINVGTFKQQIKPSSIPESQKSDEASAFPSNPGIGSRHVDVSVLTLSAEMIKENQEMLTDERYEKIDDVFRPTSGNGREICQFLGKEAFKFGAGSGFTKGKIFKCRYRIKKKNITNALLLGHLDLKDNILPHHEIVDPQADPCPPIQETDPQEPDNSIDNSIGTDAASTSTSVAVTASMLTTTTTTTAPIPATASRVPVLSSPKKPFTRPGDSGSAIIISSEKEHIALGMHLYGYECMNKNTKEKLDLSVAVPLYDTLDILEEQNKTKLALIKSTYPHRGLAQDFPVIIVQEEGPLFRLNNDPTYILLQKQSDIGDGLTSILETNAIQNVTDEHQV